MSVNWQQLLNENRVERAPATKADIDELRTLVSRCLQDSALPLFPDNKFGLVYNAARTLAVMAAGAAGYRVKLRGGGHYNTFLALKAALGPGIEAMADYLDECREKRNELSYEAANVVTQSEVDDLIVKTRELETLVEDWIAKHAPHLKP